MKSGVYCMGRLSEALNGYKGSRPTYANVASSSPNSDVVEVVGFEQTIAIIDSLLSTDPTMDILVKKLIGVATREARNRTSRDIKNNISDDPRQAYRAVKFTVYKRLFGSNISILSKRKASGIRVTLNRARKLDQTPNQRGGNRVKYVNDNRNRLNEYWGSDRGFILRFLSSGTKERTSRYGNRGSVHTSGMFGYIAPIHLQQAIEEIHDAVAEYINNIS